MSFFNHVERYGALFIGGMVEFMLGGFERAPDGTWQLLRTLEERGFVVETRDDAIHLMVESMIENPGSCGFLVAPRIDEAVRRARDWHADGVVLHCDRGCQAFPASMPEMRSVLAEHGVPTMVYESSCGDSRELNEAHVIGSLESFMEVLGLSPIS
jgi:benzoyl-CoA reductase subunit B